MSEASISGRCGHGGIWSLLLTSAIMLLFAASPIYAGANPSFTLPLHAKASQFEPCNGYLPVDCLDNRPRSTWPRGRSPCFSLL